MSQADPPILEIRDLKTHFPNYEGALVKKRAGTVKAVDGVSLQLGQGETLGLVGESGCGKSTLARTILRLIEPTEGSVWFDGRDLSQLNRSELGAVRPKLQMVFQDPYASLNPRMTVFDTLAEPMKVHGRASRAEQPERVAELMRRVGLSPRYIRKYPHEFSGGQRQRIAVARALALEPDVVIADEPVSALDVSVQAQILNLLGSLSREFGLSMILIAHDLSVVHHLSNRIAVMYLGRIVEIGPADDVFHRPRHPYTRALISAIPEPAPRSERRRILLPGDPPSPVHPPAGCPFHPRCPHAREACAQTVPPLEECEPHRRAACIRVDEVRREEPARRG
jgi:oligopeptide transport system ATP-binding protein